MIQPERVKRSSVLGVSPITKATCNQTRQEDDQNLLSYAVIDLKHQL